VRLHRFDLTSGEATVASDVPFVAIRPAPRLAQSWMTQR